MVTNKFGIRLKPLQGIYSDLSTCPMPAGRDP